MKRVITQNTHDLLEQKNKFKYESNKVGIISFYKYSTLNYGAVLHPFAFQKYLNKNKVNNVIIEYIGRHFKYRLPYSPLVAAIKYGYGLKGFIAAILRQLIVIIRIKKIFYFCRKYVKSINNNGKAFTQTYFEKNKEISCFDFETIICESDVIWSPITNHGFDRTFFADYECFKNMKKVAYAPSISNTILTKEQEKEFKKLVENFDFISSRENKTAEYIQNLTGKECPHVLDPTLLLDENDYTSITAKINEKKKYLLCYNCEVNDRVMLMKAKALAKKMNLAFIEISLFIQNKIRHRTLATLGIEEWLGYFKNAEFIVTNGYHGMCFSIIFKKNFYTFPRDGIDLKLKNIISVFDLERNFVNDDRELTPITINYDKVYEKLYQNRMQSMDFINYAINSKNIV